jgi:acetoin:2,6-dichlorophenolindophenol oxidoreductase subunit alpha
MREDPALDDATRVELFRTMVLLRTFYDAMRREVEAAEHVVRTDGAVRPEPGRPDPRRPEAGRPEAGRTEVGARPGGMRSSLLGCEPMAAGFGVYLTADDAVTAPRRPHYIAIARGIDLQCVVKEAVAVAHRHPRDEESVDPAPPTSQHMPPSPAGAGYLPAIGQAFAFQQRETTQVAVSILGRGAIDDEGFRSAVDVAKTWKLPMVFLLCEEGTARIRAVSDPVASRTDDGIRTVRVRSDAVEDACQAAGQAVRRARTGEGPSVVEVTTVWPSAAGTGTHDDACAAGQDPIESYEGVLRQRGLVDDELLTRIRAEATLQVSRAVGDVAQRHHQGSGDCALCAEKVAS